MTAVRVEAPRTARAVAAPTPEPASGEVLVRVEGCGVCGSSRPLWEGRPWFEYPLEPGAPGHEGWGTIEAVGEGVGGLSPGERVAFVSYHAFAELDVAEARACVPLPDALDGRPFPGEALGCAVNVLRRSDVRPGQRVAIVGIGFLGRLLEEGDGRFADRHEILLRLLAHLETVVVQLLDQFPDPGLVLGGCGAGQEAGVQRERAGPDNKRACVNGISRRAGTVAAGGPALKDGTGAGQARRADRPLGGPAGPC